MALLNIPNISLDVNEIVQMTKTQKEAYKKHLQAIIEMLDGKQRITPDVPIYIDDDYAYLDTDIPNNYGGDNDVNTIVRPGYFSNLLMDAHTDSETDIEISDNDEFEDRKDYFEIDKVINNLKNNLAYGNKVLDGIRKAKELGAKYFVTRDNSDW